MSVRSVSKSTHSRGTLHGPAITFARGLASAPIDVEYDNVTFEKSTYVNATVNFEALPKEMAEALDSIRAEILNKPIGQDSGYIDVMSKDVEFYITFNIEHGGKKVVVSGNVGGRPLQRMKFLQEDKLGNAFLSQLPGQLFKLAGGNEGQSVQIKYERKVSRRLFATAETAK